jgi:hypothetical protein
VTNSEIIQEVIASTLETAMEMNKNANQETMKNKLVDIGAKALIELDKNN